MASKTAGQVWKEKKDELQGADWSGFVDELEQWHDEHFEEKSGAEQVDWRFRAMQKFKSNFADDVSDFSCPFMLLPDSYVVAFSIQAL